MYCEKCGTAIPENAAFCSVCGNPVAKKDAAPAPVKTAEKKRSGGKRQFLLGLLAGLLCCAIAVSALLLWPQSGGKIEGKGYDSPEEAVTACLEALRDGDLAKAVSTFAIESFAENFDENANLERMAAYNSLLNALEKDFGKDYNIALRHEAAARTVYYQYLWFALKDTQYSELVTDGRTLQLPTENEQRELLRTIADPVTLERLQTLEIREIMRPEDFLEKADLSNYQSEANQNNIEKMRRAYGAEQITSRIARVRIDGETYLFYMDLVRYDGKWYVLSEPGNVGKLMGVGSLVTVVPEE